MDAMALNHKLPGIAAVVLYLISATMLWHAATTGQEKKHGSNSKPGGSPGGSPAGNHGHSHNLGRGRSLLVGFIAAAGAVLHLFMLHGTAFNTSQLNFSFFNSLSVTAWFTIVLLLLVSIGRPVLTLGLVVFPSSAALVTCALAFAGKMALAVEPQLQWHVLISVVAYALLTMAAVQSILVSLQDKRLRTHRPGGLLRSLPPLKLMDQVLLQLLIASFLLLTLALVTGVVFLDDLFAQRLVHKTLLSLLALILLAVLLIGHFRFGWRGQKAAKMTLGAYVALVLGYFGSKFVKELLLSS